MFFVFVCCPSYVNFGSNMVWGKCAGETLKIWRERGEDDQVGQGGMINQDYNQQENQNNKLSLTPAGSFRLSLALSDSLWPSLVLSGSLWLSLILFGLLWLSLALSGFTHNPLAWLTRPLLGSQCRRCAVALYNIQLCSLMALVVMRDYGFRQAGASRRRAPSHSPLTTYICSTNTSNTHQTC